jgi:hypothetical protein
MHLHLILAELVLIHARDFHCGGTCVCSVFVAFRRLKFSIQLQVFATEIVFFAASAGSNA